MALSFRSPRRVACHSGTLPRVTITRSPRSMPRFFIALANWLERRENYPKVRRRSSPSSPSQIMADWFLR